MGFVVIVWFFCLLLFLAVTLIIIWHSLRQCRLKIKKAKFSTKFRNKTKNNKSSESLNMLAKSPMAPLFDSP
jgi:hypothetical protein